jgi:hypothetical protein
MKFRPDIADLEKVRSQKANSEVRKGDPGGGFLPSEFAF